MRIARLLLVVSGVTALAFGACGGGTGTGAAGGSGGRGTGGTGGACNASPCSLALYNLVQSCAPSGACTFQIGSTMIATCYANGVKVFTSIADNSVRLTKPDGTTCLTETVVPSASDPTTFEITYKDASGATLATGTSNSSGIVLTCDGQSFDPTTCPSGSGGAGGSPSCVQGTCQ